MDANAQVIHGATENRKNISMNLFYFFLGLFVGNFVALLENRTHPADATVVNRARWLAQEVAQQLPWWPLFCVSVSHQFTAADELCTGQAEGIALNDAVVQESATENEPPFRRSGV